jgi:HEAT repeat protein
MDDLQQRMSQFSKMAKRAPGPKQFRMVREALEDKLEGVQSAALKALGAWGDEESCKLLRMFLIKSFDKPLGWSVRGVAVKALRPNVGKKDVGWLLDLYFDLPCALTKHELLQLVIALPPDTARRHLTKGLSDPQAVNRQAAVKAIGNMPFHDRLQLIAQARNDQDDSVRNTANAFLSRG